jgi:hypothetical protein
VTSGQEKVRILAHIGGRTPVDFDLKSDEEKLARRRACWTPTELVEAMPSA